MTRSPGIAGLLAAYAAGAATPTGVIEETLRRIDERNPELNAYLTVLRKEARNRAAALEAGACPGGRLRGVPIGLKDLFQTQGIPTTAGSRILEGRLPEADATVVRKLHDEGAVFPGKLQMHEFAYGPTSENCHHGPARNPHDPSRITGGSSGGSAAAVAAGLCAGALGSDTGGSIRLPAALCGIVGLKPTYGRVSRAGVIPLSWTLDHVGPMTRTVEDAGLLLDVLSGPDPADPTAVDRPPSGWHSTLEAGVAGLRLGVPRGWFWAAADPTLAQCVEGALSRLSAAGAEIVEVDLPWMPEARAVHHLIIRAEATAYHRDTLRTRSRDYDPRVRTRLVEGLFISAVDYIDALRARQRIQADLLAVLRGVDALVTPTCQITAPPIGAESIEVAGEFIPPAAVLVRNTLLFNLTGTPAISVPCGEVAGLPVGLQVAGRPWDEAMVLRVARSVESQRPE